MSSFCIVEFNLESERVSKVGSVDRGSVFCPGPIFTPINFINCTEKSDVLKKTKVLVSAKHKINTSH